MKKSFTLLLIMVVTMQVSKTSAQIPERKNVPEKYKWNLSILYKNTDEWQKDRQAVEKQLEKIKEFKSKLGESAQSLYSALCLYFDVLKSYYKLGDYSNRLSDEDVRIGANQSLVQQTNTLGTQFNEATSFINPEVLKIEPDKIKKFFDEKKELSEFKFFVNDILRLRPHTLSEREEEILASAGLVTTTPSDVHGIFDNAERPNAKVKLSTGEEVELSASNYTKYRSSENRADRELVMKSTFENYKKFENTYGAILAGKVRNDFFFSKNRKYNNALGWALNANNIPVSVYENLISQINKNLPTLHRYLKLKARFLGVDQLHYYDIYPPLVKEVSFKFSIDEAQKLLLDVFKPMGQEYISTIQKAFNDRWIDYIPTAGKRSGAYSTGQSYDFNPFILTNWNDDFESLSTFAHELGHTMHSYFSNKNQPFVNAQYSIFVAEIASTINETLLNNYMVAKSKSDDEKLFSLGSYLDLLRGTIFRQTQFAEYEWEIHKKIEKGEPLTGETLSDIYYDIVKKYYGNDAGVCIVDPYIAHEWAYIPHFVNSSYYVYQYSTSLIYATAFAEKIVKEGDPAVQKFYTILKGGSSEYPIDLIKHAGIDPLSSEAYDLTMAKMNKVMDQIEEILNKKK